jgi:SEFIR domain
MDSNPSGSDQSLSENTSSPKVFISYSHDSSSHAVRVLALADQLCNDGIDAMIDQYDENPREGWPLWMEKQIRDADFVLMVCTEIYHRRVTKEEEAGKGLGVCWEAHIIYQFIYEDATYNEKFLPVLLQDGKASHIPTPLRAFSYYLLDSTEGYQSLYRRLTNQRRVVKPKRGALRKLSVDKRPENLIDISQPEEDRADVRRHYVAQHNNVIWEMVKSRAERFIEAYNKSHPYLFAKAVNLVSESHSLYNELTIRLIHPEECSFRLKFKFTEALMEYSYQAVAASPGVLEVIYDNSDELKFRLKGEVLTLDGILKKLLDQLLAA